MVKEHSLATRNHAIGQLSAGMSQTEVADSLGVGIATIKRWWRRHREGKSLTNRNGRGRKKKLTRVEKIKISKSKGKRRQSCRELANRLSKHGRKVSHETIRTYLRGNLKLKSYKPQTVPRLTIKQKENRVKFCKERKNWTAEEWKAVIFSDESPFQLFSLPNKQTDRIWASKREDVKPNESLKHPLKIQVWGMMSYRALGKLHVIPKGQMVTGKYYVEEILEKSLHSDFNRKKENGSILIRKMLPDMSAAVFQQDGAPAHHSRLAQNWLQRNIPSFWIKGIWPGNSPDLSPIENLWAIVKGKLQELEPATNEETLIKNVKEAWSQISPDTLEALIAGMPNRIKRCLQLEGGYIGK